MRRKHHTRFVGRDEKYPQWGEGSGRRRWHIDASACLYYSRKVPFLVRRSKEAKDFSDLFDTEFTTRKTTRLQTASVYGWIIKVEGRGMLDDFGALKSSRFTEWRGESGLSPLYGPYAREWSRMREWGLRRLPDWRKYWDRSWLDGKCIGDFAYWVSGVVSSRWWIERTGYSARYILIPEGKVLSDSCGWKLRRESRAWASFSSMGGIRPLFVSREGCTGWDLMLNLLTRGRNKNSLPSFKALIAFTARFWGEEIAEDLGREFRKVFPATLCC